MKKIFTLGLMALILSACGDSGERIGKVNTNFKFTGSDRVETVAFDDEDVKGVTCYLSYAKTGGMKEYINAEEDNSDSSLACVVVQDKITFNEDAVKKDVKVFKRNSSLAFKTMNVKRYYDEKRKAFAYVVYSDKILSGSPKNASSAIACGGNKNNQPSTQSASAPVGMVVENVGICEITKKNS